MSLSLLAPGLFTLGSRFGLEVRKWIQESDGTRSEAEETDLTYWDD